MQLDFSGGQAQANKSDHQAVLPPSAHDADEPTLNDGTARISSDDDVPEPPLPIETQEEEASKEEAQTEMQLNFSAGQAQADDFSSSASISKCGRRAYTQQWHCLDRRLGALRFLLSKTKAL